MSFSTARMEAIAQRHIASSGSEVLFRHTENGEYDPETGGAVSTTTLYNFKATKFNYPIKNSGEGSSAGSLIESNDRVLVILPRADAKISAASWHVFLDGDWWTVINIKHETYADKPIYMLAQCRLV